MSIEDAVASKLRVFKTRDKKTTHVLFDEFKWNGLQTVWKVYRKRRKKHTQTPFIFSYCCSFLPLHKAPITFFLHTHHIFVDHHPVPFPMPHHAYLYTYFTVKAIFSRFFLMCFVGLRYVSINFIFFSSSVACKIVPFPFKIIFNEKNYPCSTKTDAERELNG